MQRLPNTFRALTAFGRQDGQCGIPRSLLTIARFATSRPSTEMASSKANITPLRQADFDDWSRLFRTYVVDFYKSTIPETQYRKTFDRILDQDRDLYGLALRDPEDNSKLLGFAHYYPHQTPWSEKQIMHLNDLFTDPSIRGKGYGRKLIEAVAEEAKDRGCFRLQWVTQHGNPARKLYDQMGSSDFVEYRMKFADA